MLIDTTRLQLRIRTIALFLGFTLAASLPLGMALAKDQKLALGLGGGVGFMMPGTGQEYQIFTSHEVSALGRYRFNRFLGARSRLGFLFDDNEFSISIDNAPVYPIIEVGGELHVIKKLLDPYLFAEAGFPFPFSAGLGLGVNLPKGLFSLFLELKAGMQNWYKTTYKVDNYNNYLRCTMSSGVLMHF